MNRKTGFPSLFLALALCFSMVCPAWASEEVQENILPSEETVIETAETETQDIPSDEPAVPQFEAEAAEEAISEEADYDDEPAEAPGEEFPIDFDLTHPDGASGTAKHPWDEAYAGVMRTQEFMFYAQLLDVDMDGTPELLIGWPFGSALCSGLKEAYTFTDGGLQEITDFDSETVLGLSYKLFQRHEDGAYRLELYHPIRGGIFSRCEYVKIFQLENGALTSEEIFRIETEYTLLGSEVQETVTYYYEGTALASQEEYDAAVNKWYDGWEEVEDFPYCDEFFYSTPSSEQIQAFFAAYPAATAFDAATLLRSIVAGTSALTPADAAEILRNLNN